MTVTITVPEPPPGCDQAASWRKVVTGVDAGRTGGYAVTGEFVAAGDRIEVPEGAVVLTVDKTAAGYTTYRSHHRSYETYQQHTAAVTVWTAGAEGLTQRWSRDFKSAKSAVGALTMRQLRKLLNPDAASTTVRVVEAAQRPNRGPGHCRWCGESVSVGRGHVVGHGPDAQIEHWRSCPPSPRRPEPGTPCTACGVTLTDRDAHMVMVRDGEGRWEPRHTPHLDCTSHSQPSWEDVLAEREADRAAAQAARHAAEKKATAAAKAAARRAARKADDAAAARAAHEAEQARIRDLATVARESETLYDKAISPGVRMRLIQHTDTLEDRTTTQRWTVETYGGPAYGTDPDDPAGGYGPFTRLADAREHYQGYRYQSEPRTPDRRPAAIPRCPPDGVKHCDNCGSTTPSNPILPELGWMTASLGLACGPACFDAMADSPGRHATRHH